MRVTASGIPYLSDAKTFTISVVNVAPAISAGGDGSAIVGSAFTRAGSFSDPGTADSWTATVTYGDGTGDQPVTLNPDKTFTLSHTYATSGTFPVTVKVTDAGKDTGSATFNVNVTAAPTTNPTTGPTTNPTTGPTANPPTGSMTKQPIGPPSSGWGAGPMPS